MQLNLRPSCCIFILLFLLTFSKNVIAQTSTVTGKVTDDAGNPLQGVSVSLKGTSTGTTTTADGTYRLPVERRRGDALIFSYVGLADKELPIGNNTELNVRLETSGQSLDAVVVVGYGTQRRKDVTGSVVSVDKQRLENMPNSNLLQAVQGAVPGIAINANGGGAEGNNISVVIRGQKSISGSRSVLIILDGIPYRGSISDINPSDIASVDILKDASALAIYGAESANGVILVTTKRGSGGKAVISYDGFIGTQQYANLPPVLTGEEFYNFKITREPNSINLSNIKMKQSE
ncbi:MAG: TonB-dependent receptor plug domain-containing protein [Flavisolibacter sp.]|nr:TonB-dependent receptor plug domain-containing protein [Flavisolibacter sp.]